MKLMHFLSQNFLETLRQKEKNMLQLSAFTNLLCLIIY